MPDDLATIIVSYNTCDLLAKCLELVYASQGIDRQQVIVVDNASSDGSAQMVQQRFPTAKLITNSQNRGFAFAVNQGLENSKEPYLLILNPDTRVSPDALAIMRRFLEENLGVGLVGPQLLYPDGQFQHAAYSFPTLPMIVIDFFPINGRVIDSRLNGRYPRSRYERGEPFPIDHPLGAAMMLRRRVVEEVGPMDHRFFMYCEEIDWCMRIRAAGWGIFCVPQAKIIHYVAQATGKNWGPNFVELHRSRYRLYDKHYPPLFRKLARLVVGIGVRREMGRAQGAARKALIDARELDIRLSTYQEVLALS